MLANAGNRFKTGIPRRNGANPYWRGLVALLTVQDISPLMSSGYNQYLCRNFAFPYRRDIVRGWDAANVRINNKYGAALSVTEAAGFSVTDGLSDYFIDRASEDTGIAFFLDYEHVAANTDMGHESWQNHGVTLYGGSNASVSKSWSGGNASVGGGSCGQTAGDRNRIYGYCAKNNMQAVANGGAGSVSFEANDFVTSTQGLAVHASNWGGDIILNTFAAWVGPPLPESMSRRLTAHPNPIELFR